MNLYRTLRWVFLKIQWSSHFTTPLQEVWGKGKPRVQGEQYKHMLEKEWFHSQLSELQDGPFVAKKLYLFPLHIY